MKKTNLPLLVIGCLFLFATVFTACNMESTLPPDDGKGGGEELPGYGQIVGSFFTQKPELVFQTGRVPGTIDWRFKAAVPSDASVSYALYMIPGSVDGIEIIEEAAGKVVIYKDHTDRDQWILYENQSAIGETFSAFIVAISGDNRAYSGVQQALVNASIAEALPGEETGTLRSRGRSTTAVTYYIDFERGNDSNDGTSPLAAWRTFKNANGRVFQPGDHILLEANSVWNGVSVTPENYRALSANWAANNQVGMLAPKGSGEPGNPIVIDLYRMESEAGGLKVYYSANQRPIINGNGTPSVGSDPYFITGAITVIHEQYWEIRNIETTNSFKFPQLATNPSLRNTHWTENNVTRRLCGILVGGGGSKKINSVLIQNNYVHDAQSENPVTSADLNAFGTNHTIGRRRLKACGGIIALNLNTNENGNDMGTISFAWNDLLIDGNIVKRVGMTGIRNTSDGTTKTNTFGQKIIFRGNYIENVAGDGFVLTGTGPDSTGTGANQSFAEYNVVKNACATPNHGTKNYASAWAIYIRNTVLQYNEVYGTLYGYQDSEAFDFDGGCQYSVYQYNYSHHNAGGAILFMSSSQRDTVYRFNVSANDGIGTVGLSEIPDTAPSALWPVSTSASSYTAFPNGQSMIHYATSFSGTSHPGNPLIYNNTFYNNMNRSVGLFGHNDGSARSYYVRFYNNIIVKEGTGTVYFGRGHQELNGVAAGGINNPQHFKYNMLWGYETGAPDVLVQSKFSNGNSIPLDASFLSTATGTRFENPRLKIQGNSAYVAALATQRGTDFPEGDINDPEKLKVFTGKERLRNRASMFTPVDTDSPAVKIQNGAGPGMLIPSPTSTAIDSAWHDDGVTEDLFGNAIGPNNWPIGAAAAPYTPTAPVTD